MDFFISGLSISQQVIILLTALVIFISGIYCLDLWVLTIISIFKRLNFQKPPRVFYWPKISIHLPIYNEKKVAARILRSCLKLDYPRDQMEIIVVDDSDDGTSDIVGRFQKRFSRVVKVIRRTSRRGFKAGALQEALKISRGEFITIFDADYIPPRDFLKKMIPHLLYDENVAFIQARWAYLNGDFSWFSKAFSLAADMFGKIDQTARYLEDLVPHFNGTCAVFRKSAIIAVGGWSADTLAEDLDLSIRLRLKGWKYVYLPFIEVPGEIPPSFKALRQQQYRWARGFTECFKKYAKKLITSRRLSPLQKLESILYLNTYTLCPISILGMAVGLLYPFFFPPDFYIENLTRYGILLFNVVMSSIIYTGPLAMAVAAIIKYDISPFKKTLKILNLIYLATFFYSMLEIYSRAVFSGFFSRKGEFKRTPKTGELKPRLKS